VSPAAPPPFAVISGSQVQQALQGSEKQIVELVEATYRLHGAGNSVNPPSYGSASTLVVGQGARVGMAAGAAWVPFIRRPHQQWVRPRSR
jgi:hypothetical protein